MNLVHCAAWRKFMTAQIKVCYHCHWLHRLHNWSSPAFSDILSTFTCSKWSFRLALCTSPICTTCSHWLFCASSKCFLFLVHFEDSSDWLYQCNYIGILPMHYLQAERAMDPIFAMRNKGLYTNGITKCVTYQRQIANFLEGKKNSKREDGVLTTWSARLQDCCASTLRILDFEAPSVRWRHYPWYDFNVLSSLETLGNSYWEIYIS